MEDRLEEIKDKLCDDRFGTGAGDSDTMWLIAEVEKLRAWHKSDLETITALTDALVAKNQETK